MIDQMLAACLDELQKIAVSADGATYARAQLNKSVRVGKLGSKKPPEPNFRAVVTKVKKGA